MDPMERDGISQVAPKKQPDFIPAEEAPDFIPAESPTAPTATLSAAPQSSWLDNLEHDAVQGGNRTMLGRIGGMMQGRGDKGFSGIESGIAPGAASIMGSPITGTIHAAQGISDIPSHPVKGTLKTLGGIAEAATLPGMMMAGPEATMGIESVPSRKYAGQIFNSLNEDLAAHPVPLSETLKPLQRATEIGARGSTMPKAVGDLLTRSQSPIEMTFPEARDYQGALSDLSMSDKLAMNGRMRGGVAQLGKGFYSDIKSAADSAGRGEDYETAMKEFRQASQLKDLLKNAGKIGIGVAGVGGIYKGYKDLTGK